MIDEAKLAFDVIRNEIRGHESEIETEQDTRFQIIDVMLTEVLGWPRVDIRTEPRIATGYVDYLLGSDSIERMVVEAKRLSTRLIDTRKPHLCWYKAGGPALKSAEDGLQQAKSYCVDTATPFAALTSGLQWIGFWALRTDGTRPGDGKAAAFPSLEAIDRDFAVFYDLFSREGIRQKLYSAHIHTAEGLQVQHGETLRSAIPIEDIHLVPKAPFTADLESVFERFFRSIAESDDPEMLAKCFVESKESREADDNLEKLTRELISRVEVVNSSESSQLQEEIRKAVQSGQGEFVLIIGNKGSGKSTFIERFFAVVLSKPLHRRCLVVKINLADSSGVIEGIGEWLTGQLKAQIEFALFDHGIPGYEELQGMFMAEYDRWRHGERKFLYERDKQEFKERFGEWIASMVDTNPELYVQRLLERATTQRGLMPCIIFDNADHFPQSFQEAVFQYAQGLFRRAFSFMICPITDKTFWQLSKSGPFQSYDSRVFYLPAPSTKDVLAKRIDFIKEKAQLAGDEREESYFTDCGIRLSIADLSSFAACVEDILVTEEYIGRIVGWLSNHNIRRSLKIAERIVTSPVMGMAKLVKAYVIGEAARPRARETKLALIRGNHTHFHQDTSNFVMNLFGIRPNAITTPLIRSSILRLLMDKDTDIKDANEAYLRVLDIQNYFEPMGVVGATTRDHVQELCNYRLIQPYDPSVNEVSDDLLVRITWAGRIHYGFMLAEKEGSYLSEMALTTPIRDDELVDRVRERLKHGGKMEYLDWRKVQQGFLDYCLKQDERLLSIPTMDAYEGQRRMRAEIIQTWDIEAYRSGQEELELEGATTE